MIEGTSIIRPSKPLKLDNVYQKQKKRRNCRQRTAIEPIIGHLKQDHRAEVNFLKEAIGNEINFILAASAFNYKKLMKKLRAKALWLYSKLEILITSNEVQIKMKDVELLSIINRPFYGMTNYY